MNNIYLLVGYNNYYNRQLKRASTLNAYLTAASSYYNFNNVINFNPNDGVSTEHIFNFSVYDLNAPNPDYMLVVDDSNNILQRWFVLYSERTRAGQLKLSLYRDTLGESFNDIKSAPIFVEKAIVASTDPAIFNSENMSFNQIKQSETMLKDTTDCAWIVGYMTQDNVNKPNQSFLPDKAIDYQLTNLNEYEYFDYTVQGGKTMPVSISTTGNTFKVFIGNLSDLTVTTQLIFSGVYGMSASWRTLNYKVPTSLWESPDSTTALRNAFGTTVNNHADEIITAISNKLELNADVLSDEAGKIIYVSSTNKYYQISVSTSTSERISSDIAEGTVFEAFDRVIQYADDIHHLLTDNSISSETSYMYSITTQNKNLVLTEVTFNNSIAYKINTSRQRLNDQPYSMFCMPYGTTNIVGLANRDYSTVSLKVAQNISAQFGGSSPVLYDIQLLPYCPVRNLFNNQGKITLANGTEGIDYDYIKQGNTNLGCIFWAGTSKGTFDVIHQISIGDYKIDNETKMYRLVSPNYNGQFEFSAAKNGGVGSFNVDFTYKPYQPYIHVNPNFGRMYGQDFDDARGLICGGKFDLPQTADTWATYERQNTNYNSIFDRQIESIELQNKYAKVNDVAGAISGSISGAATGAAAGAMVGGGVGAIAGGVIGGVTSTAAGIADIVINDKLRKENMDYTKDMYGFNLQNIQAQPSSLVGIGALTYNNKLFPFLEVYECSTEETDALKDKIRYNGMTVGRIGTINGFINNTWTYSNGWNYFKGQLIRCTINEDTTYLTTLASELNKGIFLGG